MENISGILIVINYCNCNYNHQHL